MTDAITAEEFRAAEGVDDWHVVADCAEVHYLTGSFAAGVDLITEIGRLADAADHHPDVDLRYADVTVRLSSHDISGLTRRDAALAREIQRVARDRGLAVDPEGAHRH